MSEPLRILVVIDNFHPLAGGAERAARESGRALADRGHAVDVLTMRKRPEWPAEERLGSLRVHRFDERVPPWPLGPLLYERWNAAAAARHLREHLAPHAYDVILLHPIDAAFGVARSQAAAGAARVYCFHAPLGGEARIEAEGLRATARGPLSRCMIGARAGLAARYREREQRAALRRSDAVTCPSVYARRLLADVLSGGPGPRVHVVPWGVDAERFRPAADREALRAVLGWRPHERVVLTVRRLVPRMNLDGLIRAVGLAAADRSDLRLVVVGSGPLLGQFRALARATPVRVDFPGHVSEEKLLAFYQGADLFVMPPSRLEAFGLVVLEALACGTPVLATDRGAPQEILAPLDERLVVRGERPEALAGGIAAALTFSADAGLRRLCRAYALERYPWARTAAGLEKAAREALVRKMGGPA